MFKYNDETKWYYLGATIVLFLIGIITLIILVVRANNKEERIIINSLAQVDFGFEPPKTNYVPDKDYFKNIDTAYLPEDYKSYEVFSSDKTNKEDTGAVFEDTLSSFTQSFDISNANQALFDLADKNFFVYYGNSRVSPILPLAMANVETGGRANHNITWSALFPSKLVDIKYLYTMDVTTVVSSMEIYKPLSTEYSTRDRGALQMSPTYGTGDSYFNAKMSGNEKDKLANVDTSDYSTWTSGASSMSGDRFYIPDVCLRLSAAMTLAVVNMTKNNYQAQSDMQLIAQLAMFHQQSGVWYNSDHSKAVGAWKSGDLAYKYASELASVKYINTLRAYAINHPDKFYLDANEAVSIYNSVFDTPMQTYANKTIVCTYPIKVQYSYIKLCLMYQ